MSVINPLGILIRRALQSQSMTITALASAVDTSPGYVGDVIVGRRTLHPSKWDRWGVALGLSGWHLRRFKVMAGIGHVPEHGRADMLQAVYRLYELEDLVGSIDADQLPEAADDANQGDQASESEA